MRTPSDMLTKILFIAYYFPPTGGAGVQRSEKFVRYLPSEGYLPVVITAPTSPEGRWTPHDRSLMEAIPQEVRVHRVQEKPPSPEGKWRGRLGRWLRLESSFSEWWVRTATELGTSVASEEKLIFATMSPFESGEVARRLSTKLGIPWVADLRDPWAIDEMLIYPSSVHRMLEMRRMERLLSTAALIIMNTPEATAALKSTFPSLQDKRVVTITNGFDPADFAVPVKPRTDGKFRIVHTGYLHTDAGTELRRRKLARVLGGTMHGVDILTRSHTVLLDAAERWCANRPEIVADLEMIFAGTTSAKDRAAVSNLKIAANTHFPGYLSHEESVQMISTADLLFLPMHNLANGMRSRIVPAKTYEYMATGRPILAAVPDGDARDFLERCGTGLICRPDDTAAMMRVLNEVYTAWKTNRAIGQRNSEFVSKFDRQDQTRQLACAFNSVLSSGVTSSIELSPTSN